MIITILKQTKTVLKSITVTKIFTHAILFLFISSQSVYGQKEYTLSLTQIQEILQQNPKYGFENAVFISEDAFQKSIDAEEWKNDIDFICEISKIVLLSNSLEYLESDRMRVQTYASLFFTLTDTVSLIKDSVEYRHYPFRYDFDDIFGNKNWENVFVRKLLREKKGNCHSLPYLYKILCDRLNVPCHLALAPNHIYIKHQAEKGGWYNTELTSATFPIDAWLMASGYITLESIQNGIYMDTLSEKESIVLCVIDLAQGFNHKYPDNDGEFVIECCDLALKYFPDYVNAMLLKAETRLRQLQEIQKQYGYALLKDVTKQTDGKAKWDEMNALYGQLISLGYRQMPEQMYVDWLVSLKKEKGKYSNKQAPRVMKN